MKIFNGKNLIKKINIFYKYTKFSLNVLFQISFFESKRMIGEIGSGGGVYISK